MLTQAINDLHDERGRFATKGGGGSSSAGVTYAKAKDYSTEPAFSAADKEAIEAYIGGGEITYVDLNTGLREGALTPELETFRDSLDTAFEHAPVLSKDTVVYRGADRIPFGEEGSTFTDEGYMSTAPTYDTAEEFAGMGEAETAQIFTITVPKGTPFIKIDYDNLNMTPAEMLLPRGCTLKVTSSSHDGSFQQTSATLSWSKK